MSESDKRKLRKATWAGIGAFVGVLIGGPVGAIIGAIIGHEGTD